jgi:hypothetical protein
MMTSRFLPSRDIAAVLIILIGSACDLRANDSLALETLRARLEDRLDSRDPLSGREFVYQLDRPAPLDVVQKFEQKQLEQKALYERKLADTKAIQKAVQGFPEEQRQSVEADIRQELESRVAKIDQLLVEARAQAPLIEEFGGMSGELSIVYSHPLRSLRVNQRRQDAVSLLTPEAVGDQTLLQYLVLNAANESTFLYTKEKFFQYDLERNHLLVAPPLPSGIDSWLLKAFGIPEEAIANETKNLKARSINELELEMSDASVRIAFIEGTSLIQHYSKTVQGVTAIAITYGEYLDLDGVMIPRLVEVREAQAEAGELSVVETLTLTGYHSRIPDSDITRIPGNDATRFYELGEK